MVVSGKLYSPLNYHKALRSQLAAAYSKAVIEFIEYCPGSASLPSDVKNCPLDVAPIFHSKDGTTLFDANAIAYFIGNKQLRGGEHEFYVTQWSNFTDHILMPSIAAWLYPILGAIDYNKQQITKAQENIKKAFTFLNNFLSTRTYFVDEHVTQADLTLFSALKMLFDHLLDEAARTPYPHIVRWYTTIANQPEVRSVVGEVKLCEKVAVYTPKNTTKTQNQKSAKNKKPQEKETTKKEKKKSTSKGDSEDEEVNKKPSKNPLAALPVGTFNYDEYKKVYCNEDIKSVAIPFFWEKFDPKTDSIWHCEYKFPEELRLLFMSGNLIRGMYQRLEKMQKFGFGVLNVFGEDNKSTISGIMVWRGTGLIFDISPDLQVDYESYNWTKLNHSDPETVRLIAEYFLCNDVCDGKPVAQSYVFK